MKGLPIGEQDFKKIIVNNMIYVDKTRYIHELLNSGQTYYFVSRPRRFGKTLTLSVIENIFRGEKELFRNTWIHDKWDWKERYPVIRLNFSAITSRRIESFLEKVGQILSEQALLNGIKTRGRDINVKFSNLIFDISMKQKKPVVVLVDEYEKAVLDSIDDIDRAKMMRELLRELYSVLKERDKELRFILITGITKFTKMGVFSALNNLNDVSFDDRYAQMFGYTEKELESYFGDYIERYCRERQMNRNDLLEKLREHYNGFSFNGMDKVYNPYSVLLFFDKGYFKDYWHQSGAPSFLYKYIKDKRIEIEKITGEMITESKFTSKEVEEADPISFLTQAGYLTYVGREETSTGELWYKVDFPNKDAQTSFARLMIEVKHSIREEEIYGFKRVIDEGILRKDIDKLNNGLMSAIQSITHRAGYEAMKRVPELIYTSWLYLILAASGYNVMMEEEQISGRPDVVMKTNGEVWIFEVKIDKDAKEAIKQIKTKGYWRKYAGKKVYAIGVSISSEKRNIEHMIMEELGTEIAN